MLRHRGCKKVKVAHFIRYRVSGLNLNYLLNFLKKEGFSLYKIVHIDQKNVEFSIEAVKKQNFFAKIENLCYNVSCIKEHGFFYPIKQLFKKVGVLLGIIIFIFLNAICSNTFFSVDYYGTGAIYFEDANQVLQSLDIKKYSFITAQKLKRAETEIYKTCDKFSFVSIKKQGTRLRVNLVLSKNSEIYIDTEKKQITAPCDGVVETIKVYRGTALFCVGDSVKKGDVLIDGYNEIKDNKIETYVLGIITLICEYECVFEGEENQTEQAVIFAKESLGDAEIIDECSTFSEGIHFVKLKYRVKIT